MSQYQQASGQEVNLSKSEIIFSKNVPNANKSNILQIIHMQEADHFTKYLGMPTGMGRNKRQVFEFLQDRIWKKLKGWKERNLSFAGRSVLIKVVAEAIPTYIMSGFLLPKSFCNQLEKLICNFWWGSNTDQGKTHWIN